MRPRLDILERLADKFLVDDDCWEWIAYKDAKGYGVVGRTGGIAKAHRVVYELFKGPIADGLTLDHLCRNRGCVRPDHLEPVTAEENQRRRPPVMHCPSGHAYDMENAYWYQGRKYCRECMRRHGREYRQRQRAKEHRGDTA